MICQTCKVVVPDDMHFCPVCGHRIDLEANAAYPLQESATEKPARIVNQASAETAETADSDPATTINEVMQPTNPPRAAKNRKRWLVPAGVVMAIALCACIALLTIHNGKQRRYNEGVTLLEQGRYAEAQTMFAELGGFDDSAMMAEYSESMADYSAAGALYDAGDHRNAQSAFLALGDFRDAPERAKDCENELAYQSADTSMQNGDLEQAKEAFLALGEFRDAPARATECDRMIRTQEADELYAMGDFVAALPLYEALVDGGDSVIAERLLDCRNEIAYDTAQALFAGGEYYEAYVAFQEIIDFKDAASRAEDCIQPFPGTGELYHNEDYATRSCSLTIRTPEDESSRNYIKIYSDSGDLVSTIAINSGDSAKVWLPAGEYRIKNAYSDGGWFGEEDLFGDDGVYNVLKNGSGDNELFQLQKNYAYTLSLRTSGGSGDDVDTESEDRNAF